jgi:heat shock protein HtpX
MGYLRTAILLAGLTALFMAVGYLLAGPTGATIAFFVAAAMNLFTYWNADRIVLSMQGAQEVDARTRPSSSRSLPSLPNAGPKRIPILFRSSSRWRSGCPLIWRATNGRA